MSKIEVTDKAIKQLWKTMEDSGETKSIVRVGVKGGGCSGLSYKLEFAPESNINYLSDVILTEMRHGCPTVKIVIDQKSLIFLEGTTLDFQDGLQGKGFVFNNPKATGTCGCGESFSI